MESTQTHECFAVDVADKVAHIRMIRPGKANSMTASFWRDLPAIVDELSDSAAARAVVLSAEGRHFCAGMDLGVFASDDSLSGAGGGTGFASRRRERFRSTILALQDALSSLERSRLPVLAAIQGACVGGGVDLVCAADMRYATEDAFFAIAEVDVGMTADVGTLQRMPRLVGEGLVRELAYTGRRWTASEAHANGFVNAVFADHDALLAGVHDVAAQIAAKTPMAVWGSKRTITFARDHTVADSLEFIANWNAAMFDADDMGESATAQMEGRPPVYPDLAPTSRGL